MKKAVFFLLSLLVFACGKSYQEYYLEIEQFRNFKNELFKTAGASPIKAGEIKSFIQLNYFPPNHLYKIKASFLPSKDQISILNQANEENIKLGILKFEFEKKPQQLVAYAIKGKKNKVFVPFNDSTNGKETYGGGRYLDVIIDQKEIYIDFNKAYNPYCAYNEDYNCTLPPLENNLDLKILAGEKKFTDQH